MVVMKRDLDEDDLEDSGFEDLEKDLEDIAKKKNLRRDAEEMAKESLKDIVPDKDVLTKIEEGDKDINELLRDATFKGKANSLGYNKRREQKVLLKKALKELKNKF